MNSPAPLQQAAARELLRLLRAKESIASFREYMASTFSPDFQNEPALHHLVMIHELERLERGDINRLLILAPPGSAKSTYCSIQYPLWRFAKKPHEHILTASNTQDLAENFNRRRRSMCISPEWMRLSGTKLAEDLQSLGHFGTEKHGSIRAAGIGSSIVGNRSHLNVLDDPIKGVEEALSAKTLDFQWDWFNNEFRTRLVPGGKELIVSTRWAKKDIAGRILELVRNGQENWTVLRLPMTADSPNDPLGRAFDEVLWPEYFTPQHIAEKRRSPLLWATQFQQTPLDESGSWISYEHLIMEDSPNIGFRKHFNFVVAIDLALSVGKGDFTVFVVAAIDWLKRVHIIHLDRKRTSPEDTVTRLVQLCDLYEPSEVLIDDDNSSRVFKTVLHEVYKKSKFSPPPLHLMPMRGQEKEIRATAIRASFLAHNVRITKANWNNDLIRECLEFPTGEHDDIVDALGLIGRRLPFLSAPRRPPGVEDPDEDKDANNIIREIDGKAHLNIPLEDLFANRDAQMRRRNNRV
jgi:predicted phage terminase large subunit-like protein